jgi:hypothetical protein
VYNGKPAGGFCEKRSQSHGWPCCPPEQRPPGQQLPVHGIKACHQVLGLAAGQRSHQMRAKSFGCQQAQRSNEAATNDKYVVALIQRSGLKSVENHGERLGNGRELYGEGRVYLVQEPLILYQEKFRKSALLQSYQLRALARHIADARRASSAGSGKRNYHLIARVKACHVSTDFRYPGYDFVAEAFPIFCPELRLNEVAAADTASFYFHEDFASSRTRPGNILNLYSLIFFDKSGFHD